MGSSIRIEDDPDKYTMEYDGTTGIAKLYIMDIRKSDDSTYRCKVENSWYGSSFQQCELAVELRKTGWTRSERGMFTNRKCKRGLQGRQTSGVRRPPEFTLPLYNRQAFTGESIEFSVTVTVHPDPVITWLHDGQKIDFTARKNCITEEQKGLYSLTIKNLGNTDIGKYTVLAKNPYGDDSSTAELTVVDKPKADDISVRPMFRRLLSNLEVDEGNFARFDIRVKGYPKPNLTWEKDGVLIYQSEHVEVVWENDECCYLLVKSTFVTDSGLYKVTAKNSAGTTSCQATLQVLPVTYKKRVAR